MIKGDENQNLAIQTNTNSNLPSTELSDLQQAAIKYAKKSISKNTYSQYEKEWAFFQKWCDQHQYESLPCNPAVFILYLTHLAEQDYALNTIKVKASAVAKNHTLKKLEPPTKDIDVQSVLIGIRRDKAEKGKVTKPTKPLLADDLKLIIHNIDRSSPIGLRDAMILLVLYSSAMRRSELTHCKIEHLEFHQNGVLITIPVSKGDQYGQGVKVAIPYSKRKEYCPVEAIKKWLECMDTQGISDNYLLRKVSRLGKIDANLLSNKRDDHDNKIPADKGMNEKSLSHIIKKRAGDINLPEADEYSPHSLRSGFATDAILKGKNVGKVKDHMRHSSVETTFKYVHDQEKWKENPAEGLL